MREQQRNSYALPTARRLFGKRLVSHWQEQIAIIRTAADWTVLLYLIIPGGLLGGRLYYGYWNETLPAWSTALPFLVIPLLLALLMCTGGMLLMVQEGDSLFLRQRQGWIRTLMLRGIVYSLTVTALKISAVFVLLLPFLIRGYGLPSAVVFGLWLATITCSWCIKLLGHIVAVQRQGFRRWLWLIPAITVPCGIYYRAVLFWDSYPVLLWATAVLFAAVSGFAAAYRLSMRGTFMSDVREDYKQRMQIAALLLMGVLDKPRPTRHKPWIFRKSQPLLSTKLPENRLSAAAIKALIRNPAHLKLYLQFTGVSIAAILIVPVVLKWLFFIILTSLMTYWLHSFWSIFAGDDYIGLLPFTKEQQAEAGSRAVLILLLPFTLICAAAVCLSVYGWWGVLLFIPVGAVAGFLISRLFSAIRLER
ncbi:ABC transporter permease [Paenibacillus albidus]|uniref:ABC transporter permease n=1 Tax=Paenibacillus albidus TaxID=2041023 RepID=UPI001BE6122E|nr:ABC transporter permease [Paenibacillus albidus]MBT2291783.1 ABC transporter permease [Paenibacillus albidus]